MKERAARLLSGKNVPSVLERESLAKSVLNDSDTRANVGRHRVKVAAVLVAGAVSVLLVIRSMPEELTRRSIETGTTFETICRPGPDCSLGDQLIFRLSHAPKQFDNVSIFAQRPDGLLIWYFPEREHDLSAPFDDSEWMQHGVALDGAHGPGLYTVHAVLSEEPITRATVREIVERGGDESHEVLRVEVMLNP